MDLSEAPGLVLFRVVREGIGISQRLSASGTCAPTGDWDTHPRTRASQEPPATTGKITGDGRLLTRDAQAACDFSFVASKFSPFFHRVSVMAAILRAGLPMGPMVLLTVRGRKSGKPRTTPCRPIRAQWSQFSSLHYIARRAPIGCAIFVRPVK